MDDIEVKIKGFIKRYIRDYDIKNDDDIFGLGFVNSLFSMQLILFIEKEFKITLSNKDIDLDNFKSINSITKLINSSVSCE